ncbi:hypothetical protein ACIG5E_16575 [Kitasatospora sp. NPDC053057]|uniref:hypothetical protein n=1 Tax=Kitasatospora sp. NPDC053057 TaxID=3364062 RepID=UPI0037CAEEF1
MNTAERIPTEEQYHDARAFVIKCQRRNHSGLASCAADVAAAFDAWSQLMDKNLARTWVAMSNGDLEQAAQSWAIVVEGISVWVNRPEFPPSLYDDAYASRYGG